MTRKQPQPTVNGGLKKGKIKRKQMFNELQTLQQEKIVQQEIQDDQPNRNIKMQQQPENQKAQNISQIKQKSLDEVCELVNQLMAKNKISTKNAFDVPIIDLYELINFKKNKQVDAQNTWKTLSSTLQNDYKIWGYRVDAIHSITYSILNIINRRTVETEEKLKPELQKSKQLSSSNAEFDELKQGFLSLQDSQKTFLELQTNKLNINLIECAMTSDPTLQRTKRLFDEPGLKGMLTNSININNNLQLSLFSKNHRQAYSMKLSDINLCDIKPVEHPLKVFQSIEKIKSQVNEIVGNGDTTLLTNKQLQQIWNNVKKGALGDWADPNQRVWLDVQDPEYPQQLDMMIDQNSQNLHLFSGLTSSKRLMGDFLKTKNLQLKGKKLITDEDIMINSEKWLNDIDRKFLGIKPTASSQKQLQTNTNIKPVVKPYDDVDFTFSDDFDLLQRQSTLRKQSPTKQFTQSIEDKFLTTIRPSHEFKIQKILTLRQEPQVQLLVIEQEMMVAQDHQHFLEKQVDVKRQMSSIKEIKDNLYQDMQSKPKTSFTEVYNTYAKNQQEISPALCFLTLLHLANQKNLSFQSIQNQTDFVIKLPVS